MAAPAVGIDLGTTNSVVAVSMNGKPQVLIDPATSSPLIPSVVSFPEGGGRIVGRAARARKAFDPAHTVSSVKRLLGRPFKSEEVRRARTRVAFELKEGADSAVMVQTRAGSFSLPEMSAMVLREVRRVAEEALSQRVDRCVVTVPANFNELQRSSTKIAGKIAELDVVRILNEPTAAALAYGYGRGTREKICIYDFGGGTFDVTLLELNGNVFEVLSTWGDTFLGGDDVDLAITDAIAPDLLRVTGVDALNDRLAYDILRDAAETAKCALSQSDTAMVDFNYMAPGASAPVRFQHALTRGVFDPIAAPFIEKTFAVCQEALKLAGLRPHDLTAVILVGGSTRIPSLRGRVAQFFGREPLTHLPPEEVVALGASILAEALTPGARRARTGQTQAQAAFVPPPPGSSVNRVSAPPAPPVSVNNLRGPTLAGPGGTAPGAVRPSAPPPLPPGALRQTFTGGGLPKPPPGYVAPAAVAPAPPAPTQAVSFDLDDPFAGGAPGERTLAAPVSTQKPTPLPGSIKGITDLDEPSFLGRAPTQDIPVAPRAATPMPMNRAPTPLPGALSPVMPIAPRSAEHQVPAFNLEDSSVSTPFAAIAAAAAAQGGFADLPAMAAELPLSVQAALPANAPELPNTAAALPAAFDFSPLPLAPPAAPPAAPVSPPKPPLGAPPRPSSPSVQAVVVAPAAPPATDAFAHLPPALAAAIRPPPPKATPAPVVSAPDPLAGMLDDEPTRAHAVVTDASVPSFRLDASIFGDDAHATPAASSVRGDLSVPSFRIDADDIFGASAEAGTGTLVAKSPFEASLPTFDAPAAPVAPLAPAAPAAPPVAAVVPVREEPTTRYGGGARDESTRVIPTPAADVDLPPLVVPPPVKADVEAIRANVSTKPSANPLAIGRISTVPAQPTQADVVRPGLPPGAGRPVAPPVPAAPAAPPSAPPPMSGAQAPRTSGVPGIAVPLLLDVTPLSLGVETAGAQCETVIRRNSTIPVEQTRVFATTHDNQTSVVIRIAQGESRRFAENQALGELELAGLRPAPRGEVSIAVTFELGADGTLSVLAKDVETGREQKTRVSLLTIPTEAAQAEMTARQRAPQTATA